ncbi:hypothetical protein B0H63DRAFT_139492 [Podospora didyma]|uniref:Rhodopsin domain-containing protein n=1 Tax=Podospora didyma TaxID=330526 RepID=A0AAE0NS34_9PEZI|nr:hypothetical protein B0H63DRAFT_139492 [Podospora didyma]
MDGPPPAGLAGLPPLPGAGVDPALLSHGNSGTEANIVAWTLLVFAAGFLSLRVYCKYIGHRGLWWDDYILILSWVTHLVDCSLLSVMVSRGFGLHPWDTTSGPWTDTILKMSRATITITAASWSKTAFAITLLRLGKGWVRWVIWFIIVSLNLIMGLNAMISWVGCIPVQKSWNMMGVEGKCLDLSVIVNIGYVSGGYSAACDFVLALLPWAIIWKLQMKRREKAGVGVAMSMGFVAGIMASIKTAKLNNLASGDSYDAALLTIWDSAEIAVTIMAASIPSMRVLFRDIKSSSKRYYNGEGEQQTGSGGTHSGKPKFEHHNVVVKSEPKDDDDSDRGILGVGSGKIYRTDDTDVESRSVTDAEGFEMHETTGGRKRRTCIDPGMPRKQMK